nr:hypothetical protein [Ardenticatena sp.]
MRVPLVLRWGLLLLLASLLIAGRPLPKEAPFAFGVELWPGQVERALPFLEKSGVRLVRLNGVLWGLVEPTPGPYRWHTQRQLEHDLRLLGERGYDVMLIIRGTPDWAERTPDDDDTYSCRTVHPDALDDFRRFVGATVRRYSAPPFDVRFFEIWNEPDADPDYVGPDAPYGCIGQEEEPLYDGAAYATMLEVAYAGLKAANPEAILVFGGLLLSCTPDSPMGGGVDTAGDPTCTQPLFLRGVLEAGAGDAFDMLAYHAYPLWFPGERDWDMFYQNGRYADRGGLLESKVRYLRSVLAEYGLADIPIVMNEGGLLCPPEMEPKCPGGAYEGAKANYLFRLYARAWKNDLYGAVWYTFNGPGWRYAGLLNRDRPFPAYWALRFLTARLDGATLLWAREAGGIETYAFCRGHDFVQLMWTNEGRTQTVRPLVPDMRAYKMTPAGFMQPVSGNTATVDFWPLVVEADGCPTSTR